MESATERKPLDALSAFLAGLQGGMLGACWMLAWLGLSAVYQRRSFWTAENLMASAFYGSDAIRSDFSAMTFSGLALYLLIYSSLGAMFASIVRDRVTPGRLLLLGIVFALFWYYLAFRVLWRTAIPLVSLLHAERPTLLGHLIYGTFLGRFTAYLPRVATPTQAAVPEAASAPPEPASDDHSPM
jgi:hypothetical protein